MSFQVDVVPLGAIPNEAEWDHTVKQAHSPVFYSSRFLNSVGAAPLLSTDSACLLRLHGNAEAVAGNPGFRPTGNDPLPHLMPLYSKFSDFSSSPGLLDHRWHFFDSPII